MANRTMTFNISLDLLNSTSEINQKILNALRPQVNAYFKKVISSIKQPILETITQAITSSPEYVSLLNGDLKYEFGLPDSESRLNNILKFWQKLNIETNAVAVSRNQLKGSFSLKMIQSDFSDVLSSSAAVLITEKKQALNWLEWLLLFGNQTIIKDYTVEFGPNPRSRTGQAVMRGVKSGKWSVPSEFSGTINDNWITRAIDSVETEINNILYNALKDNI